MNILLGCNHLHELGGSEQHLYTLAKEFKLKRHHVYVILGNFTLKGSMSDLLDKNLSIIVDEIPKGIYFDYVFLSHTSTVKRFKEEFFTRPDLNFNNEKIFQICHGIFSDLEKPFPWALLKYIAISLEVKRNILSFLKTDSVYTVPNPIDTKYFHQTSINNEIKKVFSLSQNDVFNKLLMEICNERGYAFYKNNKHTNPTNDIRFNMANADLVFSLGRGVYEAMSMCKNVIIADSRNYMVNSFMDGMVTEKNFAFFIENNCSGRYSMIKPTKENILLEIEKYSVENGNKNRLIAKLFCDSNKISNYLLSIGD